MSHYSDNPCMCRVDFFKPSGKWYSSEAIEFIEYENRSIHEAFRKSLHKAIGGRYEGMTAVCLEPYHINSHPIMIKNWSHQE